MPQPSSGYGWPAVEAGGAMSRLGLHFFHPLPRPPDCPKAPSRWERLAPGSTVGVRQVVATIDGRPRQAGERYTISNQTPRPAAVASEMGHNLPSRPRPERLSHLSGLWYLLSVVQCAHSSAFAFEIF
jgi:hypothetical protein